jgi:hypothetical protein
MIHAERDSFQCLLFTAYAESFLLLGLVDSSPLAVDLIPMERIELLESVLPTFHALLFLHDMRCRVYGLKMFRCVLFISQRKLSDTFRRVAGC